MHKAKYLVRESGRSRCAVVSAVGRGQETQCGHRDDGHGRAGAGSRRRPHQRGIDREGISGSALRRGQAELPAETAAGGFADRRRPAIGDRLAAAADHAERQSAHAGRRGTDISTPRSSRKFSKFRRASSHAPWATCIRWAIRTTGSIPTTDAAWPKASRESWAELDPADAAYFQERFQDFDKRLTAAEQKWDAEMAPYRGRKVVTYHNSFTNFAKHFHLDVIGYVEPRPGHSADAEPHHRTDRADEARELQTRSGRALL